MIVKVKLVSAIEGTDEENKMLDNLLRNGDFEADWSEEQSHRCLVFPKDKPAYYTDIGNIFTPPGWICWFRHNPGVWDQPEARDVWKAHDPDRVHSGDKGMLLFTFSRKHDAGFYQSVSGLEPGARVSATAWAHAWSNMGKNSLHPSDGNWSEGEPVVGYNKVSIAPKNVPPLNKDSQNDAIGNFAFCIGIDPNGGLDPLSSNVVWGEIRHIYNGYHQLPAAVTTVGPSGTITVFVRSTTLWAFRHNDFYLDDAELVYVDEEPKPPPAGDVGVKAGIQVLRNAAGVEEAILVAAVTKLVGDWGLQPNGLVIGRVFNDGMDAKKYYIEGWTPQGAAQSFVDNQLPVYEANPHIVYWEGDNEQQWDLSESMAWYAEYEIERMKIMDALGLKCVIGNFSTGKPDHDLWEYFLPACQVGRDYEAILGLHEYSCPWIWWMTGEWQKESDEDVGRYGYTTLRYRRVYDEWLIPADAVVPLIVTEFGIDPGVGPAPEGCEPATWKGLHDWWLAHQNGYTWPDGTYKEHPAPYSSDDAEYYVNQCIWYDQEMQQDFYAVGWTLFTWGSFGEPWESFDVAGTPVADLLIAYMQSNPPAPFEYTRYLLPGEPEPEPLPIFRGAPRIQYERTYVLLPPEGGPAWAAAVAEATWDTHRYTVGGSADDAGIGDLDIRRVIAINPWEWTDDLEAFFAEYYEGVEYIPMEAVTPEELKVKFREL